MHRDWLPAIITDARSRPNAVMDFESRNENPGHWAAEEISQRAHPPVLISLGAALPLRRQPNADSHQRRLDWARLKRDGTVRDAPGLPAAQWRATTTLKAQSASHIDVFCLDLSIILFDYIHDVIAALIPPVQRIQITISAFA